MFWDVFRRGRDYNLSKPYFYSITLTDGEQLRRDFRLVFLDNFSGSILLHVTMGVNYPSHNDDGLMRDKIRRLNLSIKENTWWDAT